VVPDKETIYVPRNADFSAGSEKKNSFDMTQTFRLVILMEILNDVIASTIDLRTVKYELFPIL